MLGKQFAHYVVLEQAGAGGMGVVYRARDEKLQRDVALKLPAAGNEIREEVRAKLLAEARAASALSHPHICTIYEVGDWDGQPYIAMEYLGGAPLNERIPAGGLPSETVLQYGAQIAGALECAHAHGVLHRDLKSANVRMSTSGQLKVLDFGLAMSFKESELEGPTRTNLMDSGKVSGTLAYLPPEILSGNPPDVRSDIWSLGVLLYEMASASHPFRGRTGFEVTSAILREPPRPMPTHVPPGVRAIILRCLAKEPEQRYQRASEVKAALEALHSSGVTFEADTFPVETAAREASPKKRGRLYAWLAGAGIVAVAVAFVVILLRSKPAAPSAGGKLRLLLSTEGNIGGPAISPDGKMLAYVERNQASDDLYVTRAAGGERVRLTNDTARKGEPAFSPDGERIAFSRKQSGGVEEVCTIAAFGGEAISVARNGSMATWSPDGTRLVYVLAKPGEPEAVAITALNGAETRTILAADAVYPFLGKPSWSPDGTTIAVPRSRGGNARDIWLVPANGGAAKRFTQDSASVSSDMPVFSADGSGVVFRSNRGGAWNLWYQDLRGEKAPVQLTTGPGPDLMPSVAHNGSIAFLNSRSRSVLVVYDLQNAQLKTILSDTAIFWAPAFSRDGSEIAYSRGTPDGSWHLWTVAAGGGTARQLTFGKIPEIYGRYTADGSEILYSTWGPEPLSIGEVPRQGGPARALAPQATTSDSYADASPDGKWIVFARTEDKVSHLYVRAADGSGEARRLLALPGTVPRWSPDGKWIAFSPDRGFTGGVFLVHPDGSGLKRVADRGGWPVWWPKSDKIGMQRAGAEQNTEFAVLELASGKITVPPGLVFGGSNYPFDVSRDGKWLVTTILQHVSDEIWLLEPGK